MIALVLTCWWSGCAHGAFAPVELYPTMQSCVAAASRNMRDSQTIADFHGQFSYNCASTMTMDKDGNKIAPLPEPPK